MKEYYNYVLKQNSPNHGFVKSFDLLKEIFINVEIKMLDIGGLPGIDAKYACDRGANVTILDTYKDGDIYIDDEKINFINMSILDFVPEVKRYDFINMQFVLSLIDKKYVKNIFNNIRKSLKSKGVFSFTVHDKKDDLFKSRQENIFLNKEEILLFLKKDFKNIYIVEKIHNENNMDNSVHHWHYYEVMCSN